MWKWELGCSDESCRLEARWIDFDHGLHWFPQVVGVVKEINFETDTIGAIETLVVGEEGESFRQFIVAQRLRVVIDVLVHPDGIVAETAAQVVLDWRSHKLGQSVAESNCWLVDSVFLIADFSGLDFSVVGVNAGVSQLDLKKLAFLNTVSRSSYCNQVSYRAKAT